MDFNIYFISTDRKKSSEKHSSRKAFGENIENVLTQKILFL